MDDTDLIEEIAKTIYCDSYTQYGTCTPLHWQKTSEEQRKFCRSQAKAVLDLLAFKKLVVR